MEKTNWDERCPWCEHRVIRGEPAVMVDGDIYHLSCAAQEEARRDRWVRAANNAVRARDSQRERADRLWEALRIAEAALSDIGDADREPGDDLAWCEQRAYVPLPMIRMVLDQNKRESGNELD